MEFDNLREQDLEPIKKTLFGSIVGGVKKIFRVGSESKSQSATQSVVQSQTNQIMQYSDQNLYKQQSQDQYAVIPASLFLAYNQSLQYPQINMQQKINELQQQMTSLSGENKQLIEYSEKLRNQYLQLAKGQQSILYLKCDPKQPDPQPQKPENAEMAQKPSTNIESKQITVQTDSTSTTNKKPEVKETKFNFAPKEAEKQEPPKFQFDAVKDQKTDSKPEVKDTKEAPKFNFNPEAKAEPKAEAPKFNFAIKEPEKQETKEAPKEAPKEPQKFQFAPKTDQKPEVKEAVKEPVKETSKEPPKFNFAPKTAEAPKAQTTEPAKEAPKFNFAPKQTEQKPEAKPEQKEQQVPKFNFGPAKQADVQNDNVQVNQESKFKFGGDMKSRSFGNVAPVVSTQAAPTAMKFNFSGAKTMDK